MTVPIHVTLILYINDLQRQMISKQNIWSNEYNAEYYYTHHTDCNIPMNILLIAYAVSRTNMSWCELSSCVTHLSICTFTESQSLPSFVITLTDQKLHYMYDCRCQLRSTYWERKPSTTTSIDDPAVCLHIDAYRDANHRAVISTIRNVGSFMKKRLCMSPNLFINKFKWLFDYHQTDLAT